MATGEKLLKFSLDRVHDLYLHQLSLIIAVHSSAKDRIGGAKHKKLPTEEDLKPNLRFVQNPLILQLEQHSALQKELARAKISWAEHTELIRRIYAQFRDSELYAEYMSVEKPSYRDHRRLVFKLYGEFIFPNEHLRSIFEEKSIFWVNDFEQVSEMVIRTLSDLREEDTTENTLPSLYKDEKEDLKFVLDLFRKTATHSGDFQTMIDEKLENWEPDRIASTDILLMKMALCEFMHIPSVPTKVTMNEYIEIAKEYSTPKSKGFINGILDRLLSELKEQGRVKKVGKGLIET